MDSKLIAGMIMSDNLASMIQDLKQSQTESFEEILIKYRLKTSDLEGFAYFHPNFYTRNLVYKDEQFEIILLCWNPSQKTPIHNHSDSDCWVYVVSGEIQEEIYEWNKQAETMVHSSKSVYLKSGDVNYMNDSIGVHSICNPHNHRAMSLHLYSPSISNCKYVEFDSGKFKDKKLGFYSIDGKIT